MSRSVVVGIVVDHMLFRFFVTSGAEPWNAQYTRTASLNWIRLGARSQWKLSRASVMWAERLMPDSPETETVGHIFRVNNWHSSAVCVSDLSACRLRVMDRICFQYGADVDRFVIYDITCALLISLFIAFGIVLVQLFFRCSSWSLQVHYKLAVRFPIYRILAQHVQQPTWSGKLSTE